MPDTLLKTTSQNNRRGLYGNKSMGGISFRQIQSRQNHIHNFTGFNASGNQRRYRPKTNYVRIRNALGDIHAHLQGTERNSLHEEEIISENPVVP
jgi:hypothetical protein